MSSNYININSPSQIEKNNKIKRPEVGSIWKLSNGNYIEVKIISVLEPNNIIIVTYGTYNMYFNNKERIDDVYWSSTLSDWYKLIDGIPKFTLMFSMRNKD